MIPEVGNFLLIMAFINAIFLGTLSFYGAQTSHQGLIRFSKRAAISIFLLVLASFVCLTISFITNDFSVAYVANHSNTQLPVHYRISAVWGAHEGSLLLWVLILTGWMAAVALFSKSLPSALVARVLGVMGLVAVGFIAFTLFTSNPFERVLPFIPIDGADLNPLLQDFGLIVHPPMLYMGYVGFSVVFAFAIAGLLQGDLDHKWARWSRPWTTVAWIFMSLGIALGSWWAYYELGWGGWWFWDPVENASFMPWLAGTALIHSLAATEKRGVFKSWTVLLAIMTFSLSLLGTFLVRSGVLTSVHSFANDPVRGRFILIFLAIVVGASLLIYAIQSSKIRSKSNFALYSRETALLFNNALLAVVTFMVLLGTLHPLIQEAFTGGKSSVGPPYFNLMFSIFMIPILILMPFGQQINWKQQELKPFLKQYWLWAIGALLVAMAIVIVLGDLEPMAVVGTTLGLWVLAGCAKYILSQASKSQNIASGVKKISRSYWGMLVAHLGVAITVLGVVLTSYYSLEKNIKIKQGETVTVEDFEVEFYDFKNTQGPNYISSSGSFRVFSDGELLTELHPEKRKYNASRMVMTEADIDAGLFRDIYMAMGEPLEDGAWAVSLYYKPFVRWIWLGSIFMALGGLLAISDKRYREKRRLKKQKKSEGNQSGELASE
ncbi:heme lyase CcmF/NrfE family subunit [Kangiella sediminilitoris]|uniref:Cytochrome C biogenesis protein CcmF n=1 Tax=Kangiella sediminilitoris TaxID=1144748 RepID=A0A1B3B9T7_9GAMM|nr:heme lyase CcmF/NrfE family subunit [Kangiella sediminilitoris]AOE49570.1 cytochrome C biogenesis protein CcmF [Kangiella sediminilitoris]